MLSSFPVGKCLDRVESRGGSLFKDPCEPPMASGFTISNPVYSYLAPSHGLSKAFENKQVRKFPKTILAIHSDIWWEDGLKLLPIYHFSCLAFWDSFPCLVQEWDSTCYCQVLWSELLPIATILENCCFNGDIYF